MKLYNALFKSHMMYCISCWGGVSCNKLQRIFYVQKRCIRLLFGKDFSYDHSGYYETCARARTYEEHMAKKNYCLEHTKPLFVEHKILNIQNLYVLHAFMDLFKIIKNHTPISIFNLITESLRGIKLLLSLPKIHLSTSKQNFVFKSSFLWNSLIGNLLNSWVWLASHTNRANLKIERGRDWRAPGKGYTYGLSFPMGRDNRRLTVRKY